MRNCKCFRTKTYYCEDCGKKMIPVFSENKRCIFCGEHEFLAEYRCPEGQRKSLLLGIKHPNIVDVSAKMSRCKAWKGKI